MRTILSIIAGGWCVLAQAQFADVAFLASSQGVSAATGCATDDTTNSHSLLLEGFQGGPENVWTTNGTASSMTIADTASMTTGKVSGMCDAAFRMVTPSGGTESWWEWNRGSEFDVSVDGMSLLLYLYVSTPPDDTDLFRIARLVDGSSNTLCDIVLSQSGTNTLVTAGGLVNSSSITTTTGKWVPLRVCLDASAASGGSTLTVGTNNATFRRYAYGFQSVRIGAPASLDSADAGIEFYLDLICVDSP